jgi:hypothetical protein
MKTVHALNRATTVIGSQSVWQPKIVQLVKRQKVNAHCNSSVIYSNELNKGTLSSPRSANSILIELNISCGVHTKWHVMEHFYIFEILDLPPTLRL